MLPGRPGTRSSLFPVPTPHTRKEHPMLKHSIRFVLPVLAGVALVFAGVARAGDDAAKPADGAKPAMKPAQKAMYPELEIGAKGPSFKLKNVDGKTVSLADYKDKKAVVVVFTCNNCPFAKA